MERKQYKFWKIIRIDRRQNSFFFKGGFKSLKKERRNFFFHPTKKIDWTDWVTA
jgi:hypothetical protein